MKINQDVRPLLDSAIKDNRATTTGQTNFREVVTRQSNKLQNDQLDRLIRDIDVAGSVVARSRHFKDLAKFKLLVKRFVQEAVDYGMQLKHSHSWNFSGQARQLKTVEQIDQKLVDLTETVLDKEKESIDVLDQIGEIKGLLINLYV